MAEVIRYHWGIESKHEILYAPGIVFLMEKDENMLETTFGMSELLGVDSSNLPSFTPHSFLKTPSAISLNRGKSRFKYSHR